MLCLIDDTGKCITSLNGWPRPRKKSQWKEGRSALEFARFWTVTHPCGHCPARLPRYAGTRIPRYRTQCRTA